ncbi:077c11da-f9c3-4fd0-8497-fe4ae389be65 [Sclerotinia trifoliorum]|uniref:077c11da-f9c3-4fd0-8497-fe4ae389be65 n=1 Tax=Sclerotinia trifoliorum TaxID=28548 RepID=A0A8H2ZPS4_9HELO|nr:077c11da-f9c3-4fd0-8497-fe4ae389be65 [Sclerotinia trifoliorum]
MKQIFEKLVDSTLKIFGDNASKRKTEAEPEAVQLNAGASDQSFIVRSFAPNRDSK